MRILCVGWYGHGLVGDEAILSVLLRDLAAMAPGADICVTSADDAATARRGVRSIGYALTDVAAEISRSDLVILGGGGLFTEYGPYRPLRTLRGTADFTTLCGEIPALCATLNVPCAIFSVGVDTLRSQEAKDALRRAFSLATTASVRDTGSQHIVHELLGRNVELSCDPAALLKPAELDRESALLQLGLNPAAPLLTLSLRHWDPTPLRLSLTVQPWERDVAAALQDFCSSRGAQILAVPHQRRGEIFSNDAEFYRRFLPGIHGVPIALWEGSIEPGMVAAVQALGDVHVAMRHHGVVLAAATLTPCAAIAYSDKVTAAMTDAGLGDYCVALESASTETVTRTLDRVWENRDEIRALLSKRAEIVVQRHELALSLVKAALNAQPAPSTRETALAETATRWREIANAADDPFVQGVESMLNRLVAASPPTEVMLTSLQELVEAAPNVGALHYYLGFYQLLSRQDDEASASFTRAIERGFSLGWSHSMRADARELAKDLEGAARDHRTALQHDEMLVRSRDALKRLRAITPPAL